MEALAAGTPVVAYGAGGALDFIEPEVNGVLCPEQDAAAFAEAMKKARATEWDTARVRRSAQRFTAEQHRAGLREVIARTVG